MEGATTLARPRRRWLRNALLALLAVLLLAVGAVAGALVVADRKMHRQVDVAVRAVQLLAAPEPAVLARGEYLYLSRGCQDCHGANGAGRLFVDDPNGLRIVGPQIAPGAKSSTTSYKAEDWVRTIRHGVAPTGRPLLVMPSGDYAQMSDADLAAVVAHVRQLPAVDGKERVVDLPLPIRALYGVGFIKDAAATIDHARAAPATVSVADTVEYGGYVAAMCSGCHGPALHGGKVPGGPPDWPPAPRLVKGEGSMLARYPDAQSLGAMFRSGKRPDGSQVQVMPFDSLKTMSDLEVSALYKFLSQ